MGRCDVCGYEYEKTMVITIAEHEGTFDSFECALREAADARCFCRARRAEAAGVPGHEINA